MDVVEAADIVWNAARRGEHYPTVLHGRLDLSTALAVQSEILERRLASGERLAGWKIGLTSASVRAHFGTSSQPFGYLLESGVHSSGSAVEIDAVRAGCGLEPELCWIIGEDLQGPDVTAAMARSVVAGVCAGMELNEKRSRGVLDFGLAVADNLTQWGIVVASTVSVPAEFESDALEVTVRRNGETVARVRGKDVIDDHFLSLARLANVLSSCGRRLAAGQRVITGSFSKHDVARGEHWDAEFSGIGRCCVRFT